MKKEKIIWVCVYLIGAFGFMLFLYSIGVFKHPEIQNSSIENRITIKDSTETKKLQAVVDSVVKENKRLDAIIKRKQSNVSQILINNAINKEKVLSASDSTVVRMLDSLLSIGQIEFIQNVNGSRYSGFKSRYNIH